MADTVKQQIFRPIMLDIVIDNGLMIMPDYMPAQENLFLQSEAYKFQPGDKDRLDEIADFELDNMVLLFENNLI